MWSSMGFSLPGMVTPTLDVDELDKRITDMKAVEGWLKMNLNMLQMSIQGLELQRAALSAVKAMSTRSDSDEAGPDISTNPFAAAAAMWPWNLMNPAEQPQADTAAPAAEAKASPRSTRRKPAGDK